MKQKKQHNYESDIILTTGIQPVSRRVPVLANLCLVICGSFM